MKKKGISPLIGTVLLVAIVIAMVLLIMPWITEVIKTQQDKTSAAAQQFDCITDLGLELTNTGTKVVLDNRGDVGLTKVILRMYKTDGSIVTATMEGAADVDGNPTDLMEGYDILDAVDDAAAVITCTGLERIEAIATLDNGVVCGDMPVELNC